MIYKIAILGLQNAGKTSILKSLLNEFRVLADIKPTQGIDRQEMMLFGQRLVFWDYGGQIIYRQRYLSEAEKYFPEIYTAYYVIDAQDYTIVDESIQYFRQISAALKKYSPNVQIVLLFHKWDPVILNEEERDLWRKNKMRFLEEILPLVPEDRPAKIFETSIFKPLTIIQAISVPLFTQNGVHNSISQMLHAIIDKYHFLFGLVFAERFIELGRDFANPNTEATFSTVIMGFFENFKEKIQFTPNFVMDCKTYKIVCSRFTFFQQGKEYSTYIVLGYNDNSTVQADKVLEVMYEVKSEMQKIFSTINPQFLINSPS